MESSGNTGRSTETTDRHLFAQNLAELRHHAGAEREVAELVVAYGRLCADRGKPVEFYSATDPATVPWNFALQKLLERNPGIDPRAQQFLVAYNGAMHARRLPIIYSKQYLAARLGITLKQLHWLAYDAGRYRTFYIPKSNGQSRRVVQFAGVSNVANCN